MSFSPLKLNNKNNSVTPASPNLKLVDLYSEFELTSPPPIPVLASNIELDENVIQFNQTFHFDDIEKYDLSSTSSSSLVKYLELLKSTLYKERKYHAQIEDNYKSEITRLKNKHRDEMDLFKEDARVHSQYLISQNNLQLDAAIETFNNSLISIKSSIEQDTSSCKNCIAHSADISIKKQLEAYKIEIREYKKELLYRQRKPSITDSNVGLFDFKDSELIKEDFIKLQSLATDEASRSILDSCRQLIASLNIVHNEDLNKSSTALNDALFKLAHLETMPSIWLSQERNKLFQLKEAVKKELEDWGYWRLRNSSRHEILTEENINQLIKNEFEDRKKAFSVLKFLDGDCNINKLNQLKSYFVNLCKLEDGWRTFYSEMKDKNINLDSKLNQYKSSRNFMGGVSAVDLATALAMPNVECEIMACRNDFLKAQVECLKSEKSNLILSLDHEKTKSFSFLRSTLCEYLDKFHICKLYSNKVNHLIGLLKPIQKLLSYKLDEHELRTNVVEILYDESFKTNFVKSISDVDVYSKLTIFINDLFEINKIEAPLDFQSGMDDLFCDDSNLPYDFRNFIQSFANSNKDYIDTMQKEVFHLREKIANYESIIENIGDNEMKWRVLSEELKKQILIYQESDQLLRSELTNLNSSALDTH